MSRGTLRKQCGMPSSPSRSIQNTAGTTRHQRRCRDHSRTGSRSSGGPFQARKDCRCDEAEEPSGGEPAAVPPAEFTRDRLETPLIWNPMLSPLYHEEVLAETKLRRRPKQVKSSLRTRMELLCSGSGCVYGQIPVPKQVPSTEIMQETSLDTLFTVARG